MTAFPTVLSVFADLSNGMSEDDAIRKAARELADAIDEEIFREVMAQFKAAPQEPEAP